MKNKGIGATIIVLGIIVVLGSILALGTYKNFNPSTTTTIQYLISSSVVDANNQFGLDLYSKYKSKDGNIFFSPYSISSALAMTYEGARGQTAEEIQNVFHFPSDMEKIRSDFVSIYNELNKADKPYKLTTANALWAQKDYPFVTDYFSTVEKYYDGKVTNLDFKTDTENSRITINTWVENKTNNRIKDLIPQGAIDPLTRLVLTNAIYFKANWSIQFDNQSTNNQEFTLSSGTNVSAEMMHMTSYFNYGETGDLQILEMSYLGNDLSMIILLPKGNSLNKLENSISVENLADWKKDMKEERVQVSLPKFKFETTYFMAEDLKEMGMPTAFSLDADFTGMSPDQLFISEVIHKTFVEVSESGTEAAAATAVIMGTTGAVQQPQPKIFNADHPFIFIIQQKDTGNVLFLGRLSDPSK
jgi:serpin B